MKTTVSQQGIVQTSVITRGMTSHLMTEDIINMICLVSDKERSCVVRSPSLGILFGMVQGGYLYNVLNCFIILLA